MSLKKELLPIGTVIKLNSNQHIVIVGFRGHDLANENSGIYDYIGLVYPYGLIDRTLLFFNHNKITEVVYNGYIDETEKQFKNDLYNAYYSGGDKNE